MLDQNQAFSTSRYRVLAGLAICSCDFSELFIKQAEILNVIFYQGRLLFLLQLNFEIDIKLNCPNEICK